jgi:hypothetical protein
MVIGLINLIGNGLVFGITFYNPDEKNPHTEFNIYLFLFQIHIRWDAEEEV